MPPARRDLILDNLALERFTDNTVPDRAALESELAAIRRQRYALDREEYMLGLVCLAVPVMQGQGRSRRCVAALAVQAPVMRLSCEGALEKLPVLLDAAESLSATLE
jgi:DNA-binding IclR family transcriptional regulator